MNLDQFYTDIRDSFLTWDEIAKKHGLSSGEYARKKYYSLRKKDDSLVLKSTWQQKRKNGDVVWLSSFKAKESDFLEQFSIFKTEFLKELTACQNRKITDYVIPAIQDNNLLEIAIPDFHLGKYVKGETIKEQRDKFVKCCIGLYNKVISKYNIEQIILPIGNDFFNSDTLLYTSTKGTPQHDNANWKESFRMGWSAIIEAVNYMSINHNVHIIVVQGNHDYQKSFFLGEVLSNYYENNPVVTVDNDLEQRKYYTYGKNLFGYTHGNLEKHTDLPIIMATEQPIAFSNCDYRYFRLGHLHKHMHNEHYGVGITVLPSLSKPDEWLKSMGYNNTLRRCQGHIFNKKTGLDSYIQFND